MLPKPEVVVNGEAISNRSLYCVTVEYEVQYYEFVYAVSAILLLPISAYTLVGLLLSLFCSFLRQISRLSTATVMSGVKRRSLTLFPAFPKPEVVFNDHTVADMSI